MSLSFTESTWLQGTRPRKQSDLDLGNSGLGENEADSIIEDPQKKDKRGT